tara:strand:+ start:5636 stop:6121 length:486 start_codon:yes stop_codon:yes gene_type:complete
MCRLKNLNWFAGIGSEVNFEEIIKTIKKSLEKGSKIFIGTDSFVTREQVKFATAICLHGGAQKGRYFFTKEYTPDKPYKILVSRITEEVSRSVEMAEFLMNEHNISPSFIELHIDVSPFGTKNGTSKFSEMLRGYVAGAGFECRVKPDAWASQTVADKHSK